MIIFTLIELINVDQIYCPLACSTAHLLLFLSTLSKSIAIPHMIAGSDERIRAFSGRLKSGLFVHETLFMLKIDD